MNDLELAQSIVKRCQDGGYGLGISEAGIPTLSNPKPGLDPALLTDMAMCPPQALRAVLIGQSVLEAMPTEQAPLPMTVPTVPREPRPGRVRTNEDWRRADPDTYEDVMERILGGELNVSKLAAEFAPIRVLSDGRVGMTNDAMRRAITAMISTDPRLGLAKFRELKKLKMELVEAEMLDKVSELGDKAKKAELLGAAAMAMKMTRDTLNAQGGAAAVVIRHEHSISVDPETTKRREEVRRRLAEKTTAIEAEIINTSTQV